MLAVPPAHPLSSGALRTLRAVCEAVFSTNEGPPAPHLLDYCVTQFAISIAHSGFRSRVVFGMALLAMAVIAPVLIFRFPGLHRLPLPDRVRALTKMEESAVLAAPVLAVKAIICICFYEHPDAQKAVGFTGVGFFSPALDPAIPAVPRTLAS